jgi:hypothetical protein
VVLHNHTSFPLAGRAALPDDVTDFAQEIGFDFQDYQQKIITETDSQGDFDGPE